MHRILLFHPRSSASRKPVMPLSLLAVGAMLEGRSDYRIIDGNLVDDPLEQIDSEIRAGRADVLGVTVMPGPQLEQAVPLMRQIRQRQPATRIVWGGYFPTMYPEVVLQSELVDYVIRGHNDLNLPEIFDRAARGDPAPEIPGLGYAGPDGALHIHPPPPVPSLDQLPDFPYDRIDMARYSRPTFMGHRTLAHHSSYGCPFKCNFCAVVNMVDGAYTAQSASHVAAVTERLVASYGADSIEFYDNNFFVDEGRSREFADRITPMGLGWWGYGRIDTMLAFSDITWRSLAASGLRMVFMGAETGSDAMLARMNKGGRQTTEQAIEIAVTMRKYGIVPEMSFMIGNPPDPEQDARQTMEFIRRIKDANPDTEIVLYIYAPVPLPGDLPGQAAVSGFQPPATLEEWSQAKWVEFAQHRTSDLPWLSETARKKIHDFQRVLHAAFPTVTDRTLTGMRRSLLRFAGMWRYRLRFHRFPIELRVINRLIPYERPDTAGF